MVYYHTSGNVKLLRNIIIDYGESSELSPYEYMRTYMEKCPETIEDAKITWIAKSFLEIQKHGQFLKALTSHLSEELSEEDQDYFMILFHAVIFRIESKDMQFLYKCIFNLSKPLLSTFTNFLGNNEVLTFISHVAQTYYDTNYITDKIVGPLFAWQPYISEMGHNYGEYVQKIEIRKTKPKTIPIQPNVLNRKTFKDSLPTFATRNGLPATPPNSLTVKPIKKMLTKTVIDQKLKHLHEKNKQKAAHLLNDVKTITKDFNFAHDKTEAYNRKLSAIRDELENEYTKPLPKPRQKYVMKHNPPPIKETAATLKRMNKKIQLAEQDEIQWLSDLVNSCKVTGNVEELIEYDRQESEKHRLYDMERKHLEGQISYEEAMIAKKKVQEDNKKRYEDFLKEKVSWEVEIENWKKIEMERNRKNFEKLSLQELNLRRAKIEVLEKNKVIAEQLRHESEAIYKEAMKKRQEELDKRANMIKEIKILAMIAKKAKVPKVVDLTETSGFGFLCEMSMAELNERLNAMKMNLKEELKKKKEFIKEENLAAKKDIEQARDTINTYRTERATLNKRKTKSHVTLNGTSAKEINNLKNILEEKKKLRSLLTS